MNQFGLHTSVITKSKLWTTVTPDFQGNEWDVLETSSSKLLYMGANRFSHIWKKAVPDQSSFYGPNFNYQPMLPDNSVPSIDDVETVCTLVQMGDIVPPYMLDTDIPDTPMFEGPEVSISDEAMDKIVGRLDMCMWKPSNCVDAMDQIITSTKSMCVNVETKTASKPKLIVNVETKRCQKRTMLTCKRHCKHPPTFQDYVQRTDQTEQPDTLEMLVRTSSTLRIPNLLHWPKIKQDM